MSDYKAFIFYRFMLWFCVLCLFPDCKTICSDMTAGGELYRKKLSSDEE